MSSFSSNVRAALLFPSVVLSSAGTAKREFFSHNTSTGLSQPYQDASTWLRRARSLSCH